MTSEDTEELKGLLKPWDGGAMETYQGSKKVNSVQNDSPELVEKKQSWLSGY